MTGIKPDADGQNVRCMLQYQGGASAYRARCDKVALNGYLRMALNRSLPEGDYPEGTLTTAAGRVESISQPRKRGRFLPSFRCAIKLDASASGRELFSSQLD